MKNNTSSWLRPELARLAAKRAEGLVQDRFWMLRQLADYQNDESSLFISSSLLDLRMSTHH